MASFMMRIGARAVQDGVRQVGEHTPATIPRAGLVVNSILPMVTFAVLAVCLTRRLQPLRDLSTVPITRWLIFAIYVDSMIFIIATNILATGFGVNLNQEICSSTILLCLTCYLSTKVLIYYFLVEKVYIIRRVNTPRLKSKLYLFNCFGMLLPYCVVVVLNYVYRISYLRQDGVCIIGMQKRSMLPLIIFDAVVNLYLTMLFVIPLRGLYSYKNSANSALRTIAIRSFFGALATLTSAVVNLTVLMVLKGEPAWVCLMCCNADVLFSVLVLHWVTSKDSSSTLSSSRNRGTGEGNAGGKGGPAGYGLGSRVGGSAIQPTVTTHISAQKMGTNHGRSNSQTSPGLELKQTSSLSDDELERGIAALPPSSTSRKEIGGHWSRKKDYSNEKSGDVNGYPMGKIRVQVGQVVEIESERHSEGSIGSPRGEMGAPGVASGHRGTRGRGSQSTEDLVENRR